MARGKYQEWLTAEGLIKIEGWARDGLSMTAISQHMGLSRRHVHTIRESIVNRISHNAHFAHFSQEMTK